MADVLTAEAVRDELGGSVGQRVAALRRVTHSAGGASRGGLELAWRIDEIVGSVR